MFEVQFNCAYCGALNDTTVDPSGGAHQSYVEDCQICCKPNELDVEIDRDEERAYVTASTNSE